MQTGGKLFEDLVLTQVVACSDKIEFWNVIVATASQNHSLPIKI